jgi:hypothetical protein
MVIAALCLAVLESLPWMVAWLAARGHVQLVDLDRPGVLFLDWRLSQLAQGRTACRAALGTPSASASPVGDKPIVRGCGWENAVLISGAGGIEIAPVTLNCATAAAFAMWMQHDVQTHAQNLLGERVARLRHAGGYNCRSIRGTAEASEHSTANAIDVTAFVLANGRTVTVARDWAGDGPEARFLRRVFLAACRYFRTALGPEYNTDHADHFHFDRGPPDRCP